jgi:hypothetical protein
VPEFEPWPTASGRILDLVAPVGLLALADRRTGTREVSGR